MSKLTELTIIDKNTEIFHEAFGISDERTTELEKIAKNIMKKELYCSEVIEELSLIKDINPNELAYLLWCCAEDLLAGNIIYQLFTKELNLDLHQKEEIRDMIIDELGTY